MQLSSSEYQKLITDKKLTVKNGKGLVHSTSANAFWQIMEMHGNIENAPLKKLKKKNITKPEAKQLSQIKLTLTMLKVDFIPEYQFFKERKWRADIYIPSMNVLIEYEGINSKKSRHTSLTGYSKDTEKYNKAAELGFRVIRYTVLTYENMIHDLKL